MDEHLQRMLLAGALGMTLARRAAAILEGDAPADPRVLRAILEAANESLGHFDDRPPGERWCDATLHLLDLAAFAASLG
ncbi:MAG TPA: hypothetical protein VF070_03715 [Streptosporangiaceae bacterium]